MIDIFPTSSAPTESPKQQEREQPAPTVQQQQQEQPSPTLKERYQKVKEQAGDVRDRIAFEGQLAYEQHAKKHVEKYIEKPAHTAHDVAQTIAKGAQQTAKQANARPLPPIVKKYTPGRGTNESTILPSLSGSSPFDMKGGSVNYGSGIMLPTQHGGSGVHFGMGSAVDVSRLMGFGSMGGGIHGAMPDVTQSLFGGAMNTRRPMNYTQPLFQGEGFGVMRKSSSGKLNLSLPDFSKPIINKPLRKGRG